MSSTPEPRISAPNDCGRRVGLSRLRRAPFEHFFEFGALFCILSTLKHFFALWATFEQYFTFRANFEQHMSSKTF